MLRLAVLMFAAIAVTVVMSQADAHFFSGATKQVDNYQIVFSPSPANPRAGNNSTYLNFSVLENGSNILNIQSAVVITAKNTGNPVGQIPYRLHEFSDITIPYTFSEPGSYTVTLLSRISGDEKYQAVPLEASFDLTVDGPGIPIDDLLLIYVTPAAVAIAGIAVYLHSKGKL